MTPIQQRLEQYKYEDSIQRLNTTIFGNLLLVFFLLMPSFNNLLQNVPAQIGLVTALIFFTFKRVYDWKSNLTNILLVLFYIGLLTFEYLKFGLPGRLIDYDWESYKVSKGVMFDLLVVALPIIYIGTRLLLAIPLMLMVNIKRPLIRAIN